MPFCVEEVSIALKEMGPTKAPDNDGFPVIFYQKFWHIVGKDVGEFCLKVLNEGIDISSANSTNIVLLPKIPHPTNFQCYEYLYRPFPKCICTWQINF